MVTITNQVTTHTSIELLGLNSNTIQEDENKVYIVLATDDMVLTLYYLFKLVTAGYTDSERYMLAQYVVEVMVLVITVFQDIEQMGSGISILLEHLSDESIVLSDVHDGADTIVYDALKEHSTLIDNIFAELRKQIYHLEVFTPIPLQWEITNGIPTNLILVYTNDLILDMEL